MQIVQELCRRPGLNKCGFEMPTIYIPNPQKVRKKILYCEYFMNYNSFDNENTVLSSVHFFPHIFVLGAEFKALLLLGVRADIDYT